MTGNITAPQVSKTILLLDADPLLSCERARQLITHGYTVECVIDTGMASARCAVQAYDLVLIASSGHFSSDMRTSAELSGQYPLLRLALLLSPTVSLCPLYLDGVLVLPREVAGDFLQRVSRAF